MLRRPERKLPTLSSLLTIRFLKFPHHFKNIAYDSSLLILRALSQDAKTLEHGYSKSIRKKIAAPSSSGKGTKKLSNYVILWLPLNTSFEKIQIIHFISYLLRGQLNTGFALPLNQLLHS